MIDRWTSTLRGRILLRTLLAVLLPVELLALVVVLGLSSMERRAADGVDQARAELTDAVIAGRLEADAIAAAGTLDVFLGERVADVVGWSTQPAVVAGATDGARLSDEAGLPALDIDTVEAQRAGAVSTGASVAADGLLTAALGAGSTFVDVLYTDRYGYNAGAVGPVADFVQSDEEWWQAAMADGVAVGQVETHPSTGTMVVPVAARVDDAAGGAQGVVMASMSFTPIEGLVDRLAAGGVELTILSSDGRRLAETASTHDPARVGPEPIEDDLLSRAEQLALTDAGDGGALTVDMVVGHAGTTEWAEASGGSGPWTVVAVQPREAAVAPLGPLDDLDGELAGGGRRLANVVVAMMVGAIAIAVVAAVMISRKIVDPITALTARARAAVDRELPSVAVVDVAIDGPDEPGVEVEVDARAGSELVALADAFAGVQRTATALVAAQAGQLRTALAAVAGLGRRNQSLVEHQAELVRELTEHELDREGRYRLARLEEVAARMRRTAASFLVIAGDPDSGVDDGSLPVDVAIDSAVAIIGDDGRVSVEHLDDVSVAEPAGRDLCPIVIELIENALTFSPPHSPVVVTGTASPDGYTISVADRGIGMSAEAIEAVNRWLAGIDARPGGGHLQLGLAIVASLARRSGLAVELRPAGDRGVEAVVTVPARLLGTTGQAAAALPPSAELGEVIVSELGGPAPAPVELPPPDSIEDLRTSDDELDSPRDGAATRPDESPGHEGSGVPPLASELGWDDDPSIPAALRSARRDDRSSEADVPGEASSGDSFPPDVLGQPLWEDASSAEVDLGGESRWEDGPQWDDPVPTRGGLWEDAPGRSPEPDGGAVTIDDLVPTPAALLPPEERGEADPSDGQRPVVDPSAPSPSGTGERPGRDGSRLRALGGRLLDRLPSRTDRAGGDGRTDVNEDRETAIPEPMAASEDGLADILDDPSSGFDLDAGLVGPAEDDDHHDDPARPATGRTGDEPPPGPDLTWNDEIDDDEVDIAVDLGLSRGGRDAADGPPSDRTGDQPPPIDRPVVAERSSSQAVDHGDGAQAREDVGVDQRRTNDFGQMLRPVPGRRRRMDDDETVADSPGDVERQRGRVGPTGSLGDTFLADRLGSGGADRPTLGTTDPMAGSPTGSGEGEPPAGPWPAPTSPHTPTPPPAPPPGGESIDVRRVPPPVARPERLPATDRSGSGRDPSMPATGAEESADPDDAPRSAGAIEPVGDGERRPVAAPTVGDPVEPDVDRMIADVERAVATPSTGPDRPTATSAPAAVAPGEGRVGFDGFAPDPEDGPAPGTGRQSESEAPPDVAPMLDLRRRAETATGPIEDAIPLLDPLARLTNPGRSLQLDPMIDVDPDALSADLGSDADPVPTPDALSADLGSDADPVPTPDAVPDPEPVPDADPVHSTDTAPEPEPISRPVDSEPMAADLPIDHEPVAVEPPVDPQPLGIEPPGAVTDRGSESVPFGRRRSDREIAEATGPPGASDAVLDIDRQSVRLDQRAGETDVPAAIRRPSRRSDDAGALRRPVVERRAVATASTEHEVTIEAATVRDRWSSFHRGRRAADRATPDTRPTDGRESPSDNRSNGED